MNHRRHFFAVSVLFASCAAALGLVVACSSSSSDDAVPSTEAGPTPSEGGPITVPSDSSVADVATDATGASCDPVKQDCPDPSLKCTVVLVSGKYLAQCEAPTGLGLVQLGQPCDRTSPGHDNCMKGLACVPDSATAYTCKKLCATDTECGAGNQCGRLTSAAPYSGVCWKTCTPFGTDCVMGETCAGLHLTADGKADFESCRPTGTAAIGDMCTAQFDCAADLNCQGSSTTMFTCKPLCDDTHACDSDAGTCKHFAGLPSNGGLCQ